MVMLHDEVRKLLIEAWNKTHNAKEIAECFSVNTSTVYHLEKQMRETGSEIVNNTCGVSSFRFTNWWCDTFRFY